MILDETYRKSKKKIDFIKKRKPLTTRVKGLSAKLKQNAFTRKLREWLLPNQLNCLSLSVASGEVICEPARQFKERHLKCLRPLVTR